MERHKLQPLNEMEKEIAEKNHKLVYAFLHQYNYSIEEYYNIAIFGYLKGIQVYQRRTDLQEKYDLPFICWQYMRSEVGNHHRIRNSQKRNTMESVLSLDEETEELKSIYNRLSGKSAEDDVLEKESANQILKKLTELQQKIVQSRADGFTNKEICVFLEIGLTTYYKELRLIKMAVEKVLA